MESIIQTIVLLGISCVFLPFLLYIGWVVMVVWLFSNRDNRVDIHHYHDRRRR